MVYYSKPIVTQTQRIENKPVITRKIISQPVVTKTIVSQPIIRQRIVQTPVKRRKVVKRPVYTQRITKKPIVDNQTETKNVDVKVPGQVTIRERTVQPIRETIQQVVNVNRGEAKTINHK